MAKRFDAQRHQYTDGKANTCSAEHFGRLPVESGQVNKLRVLKITMEHFEQTEALALKLMIFLKNMHTEFVKQCQRGYCDTL